MDVNFDPKHQNDDLICPITLQVFRDPVIATDGHIYERAAIQKWVFEHGTSPLTREPLELDDLVPATYLQPRIVERQNSIISSKASSDVIDMKPVDKADDIKKPIIYKISKRILYKIGLVIGGLLAAAAVIIGIILLFQMGSSRGFPIFPPGGDSSTSTYTSISTSTFLTTPNTFNSTTSSSNTTIPTSSFEFNSTIFNLTTMTRIFSNQSISTNVSSITSSSNTTVPTSSFGSKLTIITTIPSTKSSLSTASSTTSKPTITVSKTSSSTSSTTKSSASSFESKLTTITTIPSTKPSSSTASSTTSKPTITVSKTSSSTSSTTKPSTSSSASIPINVMSTYSSALTSNSPLFSLFRQRYSSYYYEVISVTLSVSGSYQFTSQSDFNTRAYFYYDSFDQYNPYMNLIEYDDNNGENKQFKLQLSLQKRRKYFLVLTSKFPNIMGSFTVYAYGPSQVNFSSKTTTTTTTTTTEPPNICARPEVHVIGIYKSNNAYNYHRQHHNYRYSTDSVIVEIQRSGEQTLVLSSYESTKWRIQLARGTILRAIYLIGYNKQSVEYPYDNLVVKNLNFGNGACGYSWSYYDENCDTNKLLSLARTYVGGEITSFHGCYQATQWRIDDNSHATSNCETQFGYTMTEFYPTCVAAF